MIKFFPLFFILLWSSAFISGKVIVEDASPFAALTFRFALVTIGFFLYSFLGKKKLYLRLNIYLKVFQQVYYSMEFIWVVVGMLFL